MIQVETVQIIFKGKYKSTIYSTDYQEGNDRICRKYITDIKESCNCVKLDKLYNIALLIGYIKIIISVIHILCLGNVLLSVNRSGLIKLKIITK